MKKIKLGLDELSACELVSQGGSILAALTGNANFNAPNPPLAAFDVVIATLQTKLAARANMVAAAKAATEDLHGAIAAYKLMVTQLAAYAESVSAGDAVKLESGGFALRATPEPIGQLAQVEDVRLAINGFPGRLHARWKVSRGAVAYEVQISVTPFEESSWMNVAGSSKSFTTIEGLASGTRVYVRVRALGAAGGSPWSEPIGKIVP